MAPQKPLVAVSAAFPRPLLRGAPGTRGSGMDAHGLRPEPSAGAGLARAPSPMTLLVATE